MQIKLLCIIKWLKYMKKFRHLLTALEAFLQFRVQYVLSNFVLKAFINQSSIFQNKFMKNYVKHMTIVMSRTSG